MQIKNTKDIESHKVKTLIYGESGAGKTSLASTLDGSTLIISAESGLLSISGSDIDYIDLATNDKGETIQKPQDRIERLKDVFQFLHNGTNYRNIFLDSLTEISELMVAALNEKFPDRKDSLVLYGENSKKMKALVKSFRDLNYNVYMTCLSEVEKDENGKRFQGFAITGKLSKALPQYFDQVYYLNVLPDGVRTLVTRKNETIFGKDRSRKLDPEEQPDLGAIYQKIIKGDK